MFTLVIGASLLAASQCNGAAKDGVHCSHVMTPWGRATVVQSQHIDIGRNPVVRKEEGPGYSIVEEQSGGNHVTIVQRVGPAN
ncbi:MAG: hypothetical protein ABSC25_14220 [Roseiarcus sp.]|jgi:hypothetical protein